MQAVTLPYEGISPQFATPPLHRGSTSAVVGRVTLGKDAWLGALSLVRADGHVVEIGDDFFLDARSTLHIAHEVFPCLIGHRVTVGKNSCVHACTVGSNVVVPDNCVILDGAVVADNVAFEPNSIVFPGAKIHGGFLYAGMPAKPVREIGLDEIAARAALVRACGDEHQQVAPRTSAGGEFRPASEPVHRRHRLGERTPGRGQGLQRLLLQRSRCRQRHHRDRREHQYSGQHDHHLLRRWVPHRARTPPSATTSCCTIAASAIIR